MMVSVTSLVPLVAYLALFSPSQVDANNKHDSIAHGRRHNQKRAPAVVNPAPFSPVKRQELRIKKRADGTLCKIKSSNGTVAAVSAGASSAAYSQGSASSAVYSSAAKSSSAFTSSTSTSSSSVYVAPTTSSTSTWVAPTTTTTWAAATTSTSAAAATTTASSSTGTIVSAAIAAPNGKKAGIAGGDSYNWMQDHIGWWYDWNADGASSHSGSPVYINMLWGDGAVDGTDASRLAAFKALSYTPKYIFGFEEPDCSTSGSANFDYTTGAALWNSVVVPFGEKGSLLGSPSMCKQADETWLTPFKALITRDWDFTNVHINKNSMAGVYLDLDHYYNTYGKPIWVSEFACVDDSSWTVCSDQGQINQFISDIVKLFESDSRVIGYGYSDGEGLGSMWPSVSNGALSASGQAYLSAISAYH